MNESVGGSWDCLRHIAPASFCTRCISPNYVAVPSPNWVRNSPISYLGQMPTQFTKISLECGLAHMRQTRFSRGISNWALYSCLDTLWCLQSSAGRTTQVAHWDRSKQQHLNIGRTLLFRPTNQGPSEYSVASHLDRGRRPCVQLKRATTRCHQFLIYALRFDWKPASIPGHEASQAEQFHWLLTLAEAAL